MAIPAPVRARLLAAGLVTLLLVSCADTGDPGQPPGTDAADADAGDDDASAATAAAPPDDNVTQGCIDQAADDVDYFPDKVAFDHAASVTVSYADTYKIVEVAAPATQEPVRYVLLQCGAPAPDLDGDLADAQVIEVPAAEVVSLTTTNLPHFAEIDAVERLVGVGTADFVSTPEVIDHIRSADVGEYADATGEPDLERIVASAPDLLVRDGFGDAVLDDAARFVDAGVPTVLNADFNEQTLLGRAEWLKFTALFLNEEAAASAAFDDIAAAYSRVADLAEDADAEPTVLVNTPFEGTWYTPGGASYLANAIHDAGGRYVFADDDSEGSLELDLETVLERGRDADVWLQAGSVHGTVDDLLAEDERYGEFAALRSGEVWAYDAMTTPGGGNAVFELAYTRADLFLSDLVAILHPGLLEDHEPMFFGRVGDGA